MFLSLLLTVFVTPFSPRAEIAKDLTVELHTHLFMKPGLAWTFRGDFDGSIKATSWEDRFSTQANAETLDKSRIGVLVLSLYANPAVGIDPKNAIREEIAQAERFVATHPLWIIARSPQQAQFALERGKRVIILSLEGASKILDNEADLEEFIDRRGIRIVTLLHLADDRYGGVAYLSGIQKLGTPFSVLRDLFETQHDKDGHQINTFGLTPKGLELAKKLVKRRVWIDLAHASDRAQKALVPFLKSEKQPLLYTHTTLRRYRHAERSINEEQLADVRNTGGIIGIVPSEDVILGAPARKGSCLKGCSKESCAGSVNALTEHYVEIAREIGAEATMLGTDYNGGMRHLSPACGTGTSLDQEGLWNIGQAPELWSSLQHAGAPVPIPLSRMVDRFIKTWAKAWTHAI